jgi:hypothetical protein
MSFHPEEGLVSWMSLTKKRLESLHCQVKSMKVTPKFSPPEIGTWYTKSTTIIHLCVAAPTCEEYCWSANHLAHNRHVHCFDRDITTQLNNMCTKRSVASHSPPTMRVLPGTRVNHKTTSDRCIFPTTNDLAARRWWPATCNQNCW